MKVRELQQVMAETFLREGDERMCWYCVLCMYWKV